MASLIRQITCGAGASLQIPVGAKFASWLNQSLQGEDVQEVIGAFKAFFRDWRA